MKVRDVQSDHAHTITPDSTVRDALRMMGELQIRHLPVVDASGSLIGLLADRALLEAAGELESGRAAAKVEKLVRKGVPKLTPEDTLVTAAMELISEKLGCLPVVEGERGLVGVLSESDLIRAYATSAAAGDPQGVSEPRVADLMSKDPMTLGPTDTLLAATEVSRQRGFRHFPILDRSGELMGVVSDRDLCRAIGADSPADLPLDGVMTRGALTVEPQDSVLAAAQQLLDLRISCLPVVEDERLVGMLTTSDLLDHCLVTLGQD